MKQKRLETLKFHKIKVDRRLNPEQTIRDYYNDGSFEDPSIIYYLGEEWLDEDFLNRISKLCWYLYTVHIKKGLVFIKKDMQYNINAESIKYAIELGLDK